MLNIDRTKQSKGRRREMHRTARHLLLRDPPIVSSAGALSSINVCLPHVLPVVLMVHNNVSAILDGIAALLIASRIALVTSFWRIEQAPLPPSQGRLQRIAS